MSACTDTKQYSAPVSEVDPLAAAGRDQRSQIFNSMNQMRPGQAADTQTTLDYLRSAAANPGFQSAANLATSEINGDYLHGSPEFDNQMTQMRAASDRSAADAAAGVRDQFARNGMGFSTANAAGQQSAKALGTAQANQAEAVARAQNYANERGIQNQAIGVLDNATSQPATYLSQLSSARYAPLTAQAGITQGLASGNTKYGTPTDTVQTPGMIQQATGAIGSL